MAGAGANLILFSTGLGTPTVIHTSAKGIVLIISTTLPEIIDFNAGPIITGEKVLMRWVLNYWNFVRLYHGTYISCTNRMSQDDFLLWKRGVSL